MNSVIISRFTAFMLLFMTSIGTVWAVDKPAPKPASRLVISIEDAVGIGMKRNRELEIARLDQRMAGQKARESWAEVLPHVTSSVTYTRTIEPSLLFLPENTFPGISGPIRIGSDNSVVGTLRVDQNIFKLSAIAGIRASSLVKKISKESFRQSSADVEANIRKAYFDALIAREKLVLVEQSIARWDESRRDTNALFRQGVAADIDTLKAYLSVENLKPDLIRARSSVMTASTRLKSVMGIEQETELELTDRLLYQDRPVPADLPTAYAEALKNRPDVRSLTLQLEAEDEKVTAVRSEGMPSLSAFGQMQMQSQFNDDQSPDVNGWPTTSSVGLQLSVPIFSGFGTSAKIEQSKINRMQTRTRLEELKEKVRADVEIRLWNLLEARKRIEVQSRTISVAERSYRITTLRMREGIGSRLELTDAELQLNTAKTNYLQAVYDYLVASVELEKSLGRIAPAQPST
ncbi:MAG: TolC family protein [Chlorobiaceae bacterium]|nr:TolC family protein [Chlorobiaceae bacterium]NTW73461.1 TolC family protein [Chlorobiaceae bacterium]